MTSEFDTFVGKRGLKLCIIHGKVEEVGTHDSLMSKDGLYAKLAKIQWN
ncbi:hypothetical protein HC358_02175 [Wolbachia pipientis]|uniref:ABC transporter ATP-binding protein n=1 Tax=Wolbachia pipientis TaxID=955 RepID=A0A7G5C9M3_WOLPI|nr:hypothetical protein [Wolbachia pipientis]QMV45907.1 hypothetical protein HC358_02175 [Wolbachia pipientis]